MPVGGTGTRVPVAHLPLVVLFSVSLPEASRRVVVMVPPPWELSLPVSRKEADKLKKALKDCQEWGATSSSP